MNDVTKKSNAPVSYAEKAWQSDVIVDLIKHYDFPYIARATADCTIRW